MTSVYLRYINEYKKAIDKIESRKNIVQTKAKQTEEKREKVRELQKITQQITIIKQKQASCRDLETQIEQKKDTLKKRKALIDAYKMSCLEKQEKIIHSSKYIHMFENELYKNDNQQCEKKIKEFNLKQIVFFSRQRIMLYELATLLLNEHIGSMLYQGMFELHKEYMENKKHTENVSKPLLSPLLDINLSPANKEDEISTGLGYCVLLLNAISKYCNLPLVYPMSFVGSRSVVMKRVNENYPLYATKVFDKAKFDGALRNFFKNVMQVFEFFNVDPSERKTSFRRMMEILIKLLFEGKR